MTSFKDLTLEEQADIAIRIAALAIMDGVETYEDMKDEAEWLRSIYWDHYRSVDDNPAMWNCYLACIAAASYVENYWLALHHEVLGCRYDDRMERAYTSIRAIIDDIEAAQKAKTSIRVAPWPESTTPIAMTLEESDSMRATGEYDADPMVVARSFADEWMRGECPDIDLPASESIEEDLERYEAEYDDLRDECGDEAWTPDEVAAYLYEQVEQATSGWTDEDELALDEFASLLAYEMDDDDEDDDIVDEWHEWLVLAGELERIDSGDEHSTPVWAWCPDHRAELPGADDPISHLDEAKRIFDAYDPMGLWFAKRHAEAMAGEEPQLWRRYEVDLVCQTCTRDSDGIIAVRDDAVRLSKDFDVDGDAAAQALISSILSHI